MNKKKDGQILDDKSRCKQYFDNCTFSKSSSDLRKSVVNVHVVPRSEINHRPVKREICIFISPPPSRDTYDGKLLERLVTNSDKGNTNLVEIGQINQPSTNGARNRADLSVSSVTNTSGSRCREGINYFNASRWKRERVHATCLARV